MRITNDKIIRNLVWPVRILTGCLFIFSGFTKGVDPWGTIYKTEEYLNIFGWNFWDNLIISFAFFLCSIEFLIGICLLLGCFRKSATWVALLLMIFLLPLTFWIAIKNPVADCGCFGEAYTISNWGTFLKNVILTCFLLFLLKYNYLRKSLVINQLQWLVVLFTSVYIVIIEFIGYSVQPLIDFRSFPKDTLIANSTDELNEATYHFVYKKGNNEITIGENDEIPSEEDGWQFEKRIIIQSNTDIHQKKVREIKIFDKNTGEELYENILGEGMELILFIPEINKISSATIWKINSLYDYSEKHDIKMIAIVNASKNEIQDWEDISMAEYPIYIADDSLIKQIVRGNPGIVFLNNGVIEGKISLKSLNVDSLTEKQKIQINDLFPDNMLILRDITYYFIILILFLISSSFIPFIYKRLNIK